MLDRALRETFRNYSTFLLICLIVTLPLGLAHSYVFRHVIEVHELHDQIASFPPDRTVRDVGPDELDDYRNTLLGVAAMELVSLLLLVGPVGRVLDSSAAGRVPTVVGSFRRRKGAGRSHLRALVRAPGPLIAATAIAAVVGVGAEKVGLLLAQPLGDERAWLGVAVAQALARAGAAPFFLVAWATASREKLE